MSRVSNETQSWAADPEGDVLAELRKQLDTVKARLTAHREQMEAAGLAMAKTPDAQTEPE